LSKTRESDAPEDFEPALDAFALKAKPPATATPAVAPIPMTTVLRFTALCFTESLLPVHGGPYGGRSGWSGAFGPFFAPVAAPVCPVLANVN
jgi:hypothetical protein